MSSITKTDIVIIGAGVAGVECAAKLYSYGFKNLVVLEAQDYIGGRIKTTLIDNDEKLPLEIGACWIHGYLGNPLYNLVKENPKIFQHKKKKLFNTDVIYCADENGNYYPPKYYESLWDQYNLWNIEAKHVWVNDQKTSYKSYTEFMEDKLEKLMLEEQLTDDVKRIKRAILKRFLKQETVESGCDTMDLCSLNEYGSYLKPYGPDYEFPGGFSRLIQYITDQMPKDAIKTSHAVKNVTVLNKDQSDNDIRMLVECYNGACFETKHIVCTTSINYLKKHYKSLFDPILLTERKVEAIESVKMDTVDKIFLFYDDMSFFPEACDAIHPLYLNERPNENNVKENWWYKVFTFDRFYDNMLLVWITGKEADYVETLPEDEIADVLTNLLKNVLKKNVPKPSKVVMTKWHSNPYVLGSYSYVDTNGSASRHINDLAEPLYINNVPRVQFAGEATHLRYYSTVHGAYLSGQRESKRLIDFYSRNLEKLPLRTKI